MSWGTYYRQVIADRPQAFWPLGVHQAGVPSSFYESLAADNRQSNWSTLGTYSGTNNKGALNPRRPSFFPYDPWVASGTDDLYSTTSLVVPLDLTWEAWVYLSTAWSPAADVTIVSFGLTGNVAHSMRAYNNNFEAYISAGGGSALRDVIRIPTAGNLGRWVHLCATYRDNTRTWKMSMDGVERGTQGAGSGSSRDTVGNMQVFIGRYNQSFNSRWPANSGVCCVSVYDRYDPLMGQRHYRAAMQS